MSKRLEPNHRFDPIATSPQFPVRRQRLAVAYPYRSAPFDVNAHSR